MARKSKRTKLIERIQKTSKRMIEADKELDKFRRAYEQMARLLWELPRPLNLFAWMRKMIDTSPYDAIRGCIRALSNLKERVEIEPVSVLGAIEDGNDKSIVAKKKANEWEKSLQWQMDKATKRQAGWRDTVIWNASVHDEIVGKVIHVPTEAKVGDLEGVRRDAALRFGDWAVRLVDVKSMHIEYSTYMPERCLAVYEKTAQELLDDWGDAVSEISVKIRKDEEYGSTRFYEFDYVDYDNRFSWAAEGETPAVACANKEIYELMGPEPWLTDTDGNPVPFLPYVAVVGGTITDDKPEFRRKPILYPVYMAQLWVNDNIMKSLEMSTGMAEAGSPRIKKAGPGAQNIVADYGEPAGEVVLNAYQTYEVIQRLGIDPQVRELISIIDDATRRSTVSDILVTGAPLGGVEAVSGYNLQLQTAITSLGAQKNLAQRFYVAVYETMLLITHYTGGKIVGYDGIDKYVIDSEEIDPKNIYLSVELTADVPADRISRITAANQMAQNLQYPMSRILPMLGETDPEGAREEWMIEQYMTADWMGRVQRHQMEVSGQIEQMAMQMAQGMVQQMQQQAPTPEESGARGNPPNLGAPPGMEGVEGPGFNPALGQTPPIEAGMGATYEGATGRTRGGQELA